MRSIRISSLLCAGLLACAGVDHPAATDGDPARATLARAKAASGGARWDRVTAITDESSLETGGLRGQITSLEELTTGRSVSRYTLGPLSGADGHDGAQSWSQAPGGEVTVGSGPADKVSAANTAWLTARAYWFPGRRPGRVERQPDRAEGGRSFQVVRATPTGGRPLLLWFDGRTGLLDRIVDEDGRNTTTTHFSDYREVDGLRLPFALRVRQGDPRYDTVVRVSRYRIDPPVAADAFAAPRAALADAVFAGGADRTELDFELVNNHIYVQAEVDGRPVRLLVDTGGANVLTPAAATALGLQSQGALQAQGAGEKSQDLGVTRAGSLRLGGVTIERPVFYVIDLAPLAPVEGVELAGLVGYEVFHRFIVRIDYAGRRLTLFDPARFDPSSLRGTILPFTWNEHVPVVEGVLDGVPGQFTIDTGSRAALTLNAGFTARHKLVDKYGAGEPRVIGWGVGGPVRSRPVRLGDLSLGPHHVRGLAGDLFEGAKGAFADRYHAGNIGSGLLRRFTVTFDYPRTRLALEPNRDFATADDFDRSGMWINARPNAFEVMDVVAGGPAARAGLAAGDLLVSLGGQPARFDDLPAVRQRLRALPAGTRLPVVYERAGAQRKATLVLADGIPAAGSR